MSREKYTTAEQLLALAPEPAQFGVAAVKVRDYQDLGQSVVYSPTADDPGHSDVIGTKTNKTRRSLGERAVVKLVLSATYGRSW